MKWQQKWITSQAINYYFNIPARSLTEKLQGTPHIKKSNIRCGKYGKYWLYDMEYLMGVLGLRPMQDVPDKLIQA